MYICTYVLYGMLFIFLQVITKNLMIIVNSFDENVHSFIKPSAYITPTIAICVQFGVVITYCALSTQQIPYLTSLLYLSNIPMQLRSSISLIVPKIKFNVLSLSLRPGSGMNSPSR